MRARVRSASDATRRVTPAAAKPDGRLLSTVMFPEPNLSALAHDEYYKQWSSIPDIPINFSLRAL